MGGGPSRDGEAAQLDALCRHLCIPADAELLRQLYRSIHLSRAIYEKDVQACADNLRELEGRVMQRGEPIPFARIQRTLPHAFQPCLWAEDDTAFYVSFRGSQEPRDWAVNFTADAVTDPDFGIVHKGFLSRAQRVPVRAIVETAARLNKRLVLCGHSMGGAVACLVLARIIVAAEREGEGEGPWAAVAKTARCFTFGQPQFASTQLANRIPWRDHLYPFVADNDIVPYVQMLLKGAFGPQAPPAGAAPVAHRAPGPLDKILLGFLRADDLSYRPLSRMWVIEDSKSASPTPEKPTTATSGPASPAGRASIPVEVRVVDAAHFDSKVRGHHLAPFGELQSRHTVDNYVLLFHRPAPSGCSWLTLTPRSLTAGYSYAWPPPPYSAFNAPADLAPRPTVAPPAPQAPRPTLADRDATPHGFAPLAESPPGAFGAVEGATGQLVFKASGENLYMVTAAELRYEQATYESREVQWTAARADSPARRKTSKGADGGPDPSLGHAAGALAVAFGRPGTRCGEARAELRLHSDFYCLDTAADVLFARVLLLGPTGSGKTTLIRAVAERIVQRGVGAGPSSAPWAVAVLPEQTHLVPNRRSGEGVVRFGFLELLDRNGLERYTGEEVAAFRRDFIGPEGGGHRRPDLALFCVSPLSALLPASDGPDRPPAVRGLLGELRAAGVPVLPVLTNVHSVDPKLALPMKLHALERHLGVRPEEWVRVNSEEIHGRAADVGPVVEAVSRALSREGTRTFASGVANAWSTELDAVLGDRVAWAVIRSAAVSAALKAAPMTAPALLLLLLWAFRPR